MRILFTIFLLFFLNLSGSKTQAQLWEIGAKVGATGYMGDLNPVNPFQYNRIGFGVSGKRNLNPTWGIRGVLNYTPVQWSGKSNLVFPNEIEFQNEILEGAILGEFNFKKFFSGGAFTTYTPYMFTGIGFHTHHPKLSVAHEESVILDKSGVPKNSSKSAFSLPFGAGIKYSIKNSLSIGAELMYSLAFTNNIDGIEGYKSWPVEDKGTLLLQNGSGYPYDGFMSASISVTYSFLSDACIWW